MKKLFKGEKIGFRTGLKQLSLLFACFSLNYSVFPQIPINGFCSLESYSVPAGFRNIIAIGGGVSNNNDFVFYSPELNKICIAEYGDKKYVTKIISTPGNGFSNILYLKQNRDKKDQYVFASRRNRVVGCFEFSRSNRIKITAELKFDSYPGNICTADIDNDGNSEILVSGDAFRGLSLLALNKYEISELKIAENDSYGEAIFADISNDGYKDIAAFNLFTGEIEIFYNDLSLNFRKVGSIEEKGNVENLSSFDINKDFYPDIIYCSNKSIKILKGDYQSAYDSSAVLVTKYLPHRYSIADFNGNRFLDIAYIDTIQGMLSIFFAKGSSGFYPEVLYHSGVLVDLTSIKAKGNTKLGLIDRQGKLSIISRIASPMKELIFVPAVKPGAVSFFPSGNSITGFGYIDEVMQEIILIKNSDNNIPSVYYSFPVSDNHKELLIKSFDPYTYEIFSYTTGKKLFETTNIDLEKNRYDSNQLYTWGAIDEIKIGRENDATQIYTAYNVNNKLRICEYEYHDFRYTVREYDSFNENIISPLLILNKNVLIYYWQANEDSLYQFYSDFRSDISNIYRVGTIIRKEFPGVNAILQSELSYEPLRTVSFLVSDDTLYSVVTGKSFFKILDIAINENDYNINGDQILNFEQKGNNIFNAVHYSESNQNFLRIEVNLNTNKVSQKELFKAPEILGFARQKLSDGKEYLIYSQQEEGKLILKQLEK